MTEQTKLQKAYMHERHQEISHHLAHNNYKIPLQHAQSELYIVSLFLKSFELQQLSFPCSPVQSLLFNSPSPQNAT